MPKFLPVVPALFFVTPVIATGQELPGLITDRPDFTESASVVPVGTAQLEMGSTWERTGGRSTLGGAEVLARWGILRRVELRMSLPDYLDSEDVSGWGDAAFGAKVELGEMAGWQLGIVGDASVPLGDAHGVDGTEAGLIVTAGRDLGGAWSLGTQLTGTWASAMEEITLAYTAVVGFGLSDAVGAFVEVAVGPVEEEPRAVLVHHGYTFLLGQTIQLDVHGAVGLSDAAPDGLIGVGLSTRVGG